MNQTWDEPGKTILPVVVGDGRPPGFLQHWQAVHVDPKKSPAWTQEVIETLGRGLDAKSRRQPMDLTAIRERWEEIGWVARSWAEPVKRD